MGQPLQHVRLLLCKHASLMLCKHSSNRRGWFAKSLLHSTKEQIGGGCDPTRPLVELSKPWYFIQGKRPGIGALYRLSLSDGAGLFVRPCRIRCQTVQDGSRK